MQIAAQIIRYRKKNGWSQEDLAEKVGVSRQSVSKWESASSMPDLDNIIRLADIFKITTDELLKADTTYNSADNDNQEPHTPRLSMEDANRYVDGKVQSGNLTARGVMLCICSIVPLFLFLADTDQYIAPFLDGLGEIIGVISILIMVGTAIRFFIKTNRYESAIKQVEEYEVTFDYAVQNRMSEALESFRETYNQKLSLGIFLFITSSAPLMLVSSMGASYLILPMLSLLIVMVAIGVFIIIPASAQYNAYKTIIDSAIPPNQETKLTLIAEKLGAVYWPFVVTIYLGWSFWTMDWGRSWIIFPVAALLFTTIVGLINLFDKKD